MRTLDFLHAPAPWDAHREVSTHDFRGIKTLAHGRASARPPIPFQAVVCLQWDQRIKPSANGESVSYRAQSAAEYGTVCTASSGGNLEALGQRGISELQRAQSAGKRHYRLQLNTFCTQSGVTEPGERLRKANLNFSSHVAGAQRRESCLNSFSACIPWLRTRVSAPARTRDVVASTARTSQLPHIL